MKRSLVEGYALAVCFATLSCFVIASGIGIYDIIGIINPEFTIGAYIYDRHQSDEGFSKQLPKDKIPAGEELTKLREASYQEALRSEKRSKIQSLTQVFIFVFIDIIVFTIHWFIGKRARSSNQTNTQEPIE